MCTSPKRRDIFARQARQANSIWNHGCGAIAVIQHGAVLQIRATLFITYIAITLLTEVLSGWACFRIDAGGPESVPDGALYAHAVSLWIVKLGKMLVFVSIKDCGGHELLVNGGVACQEEKMTGTATLY